MSRLVRALPGLEWLAGYDRQALAADVLAAVIVTIMLIPQSLAYAMLAGLPAQVGLYASMLPLLGYALFGSSRTLAVGPVAVVSLMTATAVGQVAAVGTDEYLGAAVVLAALSGLILIGFGLARLGFLANLLSHPVISGFITASGLLIAVSQLKHLLGVPVDGHNLPQIADSIWAGLGSTSFLTLLIGGLALAALFWARSGLRPLFIRAGLSERLAAALSKAGPILVVAAATACVAAFGLASRGVGVVGQVPAGLPELTLPAFDGPLWGTLLSSALLISVIGFVESVSVAQTLAARRRERVEANRELVGLGAANLASAFSGAYPVTGGFARSVVNYDAGARTPLAGVFTALGIGLAALFLTPFFEALPKAVLAATIVVAVLSLVDLEAIRRTWRYSKGDFSAMGATILVVLLVGIEAGVVTGVCLSILIFLWRTSRPHMAVVGRVPGTEHFRNVDRHSVIESERVLTVRVDESLYFANARFLEDRIYDLVAARPTLEHAVLMCPAVNLIDASALESLESLADRLETAGVRLHLSEVKGPVMDRLRRSDFFDHFQGEVFRSQHEALLVLDPVVSSASPRDAPALEAI